MTPKDILQVLKEERQKAMVEYLVTTLNTTKLFSDEDNNVGVSSTMLEHWSDECTEYLRENGYTGGELFCIGKYFSAHGAIYVLFDRQGVTYEEANEYLERLGAREPLG